jgi:hypothetical protein
LASKVFDVIFSAFWLYEISYLTYWCYSFQMCLLNVDLFASQCYYWFTPPVIYILFTLNATMCYMFGVITFIVFHMIHSSLINRVLADFEHTIIDFLTIQGKCARWSGYQFMLLYLNGMFIFWSYSYAKIFLNINYSFF